MATVIVIVLPWGEVESASQQAVAVLWVTVPGPGGWER